MADEANPPSPPGPGESRRDHDHQPPSHEGGRQGRRQVVEGPLVHADSIRNPSASSGAAAGGAAETMDEEEEAVSYTHLTLPTIYSV